MTSKTLNNFGQISSIASHSARWSVLFFAIRQNLNIYVKIEMIFKQITYDVVYCDVPKLKCAVIDLW